MTSTLTSEKTVIKTFLTVTSIIVKTYSVITFLQYNSRQFYSIIIDTGIVITFTGGYG